MSHHPSVAVIIPCHNYGVWLPEAIDSVLSQTAPATEIVVVDDGSSDNTAEVCRQYPNVKYVWQENCGAASARNTGLRHSDTESVLFLDADDLLRPTALERLCAAYQHLDHEVGGVFAGGEAFGPKVSDPTRVKPSFAEIEKYIASWVAEDTAFLSTRFLERSVQGCIVPLCSALLRREVFDRVGLWNEDYRCVEDRDMFIRILDRYKLGWIPADIAKIRRHNHNISHKSNWIRNHCQILKILDDTSRADWATDELRHLARNSYVTGAYRFGQKLADTGNFGEATQWLWRSVSRGPLRPERWIRLLQYSTVHKWKGLRGVQTQDCQ